MYVVTGLSGSVLDPAIILNVTVLEMVVEPPLAIEVPVVQPVPVPSVAGVVLVDQQRITVPPVEVEQVSEKLAL